MKRATTTALVLLLAACASTRQPLRPPDILAGVPKAKVLLVGTFHFDDPKLDTYKPTFPYDTMSAARQAQIAEVAAALAKFAPTKVGLEFRPESKAKVDQRYADYLAGKCEITANEVYQLGFRIARASSLPRVDGIDVWGGDVEGHVDVEKYAKEHGQEAKLHDAIGDAYKRLYEYGDELKTKVPLRDYLLYLNSPEYVRLEHGDYLHGAFDVGSGSEYAGADSLAGWWYDRNLRMFENVRRLIASPQDRIVVIVGAGHLPILRHLFESAPDMELELTRFRGHLTMLGGVHDGKAKKVFSGVATGAGAIGTGRAVAGVAGERVRADGASDPAMDSAGRAR